ncbi:hypothetical protein A28LD_0855 [Idiomarina sp. A28L]|uniref:hypothetical protein n=1 Tax=Idiomarina sp. A28L TaxID=1036674 RepID=UPI000213898F|nr:hypothetical protein [Idiomarina sp. A28L]EGN75804.1 hypothetical protein A28LD_0855 [Idiomarina sp. A28L]
MKMKSLKHLLVIAAASGSMAITANAAASEWNYVGGGFYDFGDGGFYLEGSTHVAERLVLNAEIGDTYDTILRVGGKYLTDLALGRAPMFITAGYSDYSFDSGVYFGAGVSLEIDQGLNSTFELMHDTAADGFFRFRSGLTYALSNQLNLAGSYSLNNRGWDNELRIGVQYKF